MSTIGLLVECGQGQLSKVDCRRLILVATRNIRAGLRDSSGISSVTHCPIYSEGKPH